MNVEPHAPLSCCTYATPTGEDDDSVYALSKGKSPHLYRRQCRDKERSVITCHGTVLITREKEREHTTLGTFLKNKILWQ